MPQATYQMQGNVGLMPTIWETYYYGKIGIMSEFGKGSGIKHMNLQHKVIRWSNWLALGYMLAI